MHLHFVTTRLQKSDRRILDRLVPVQNVFWSYLVGAGDLHRVKGEEEITCEQ